MDIYKENGYNNRKDYLDSLADEYGVNKNTVYDLASVLGRSEDFDALVSELEDLMWDNINTSDDEDYGDGSNDERYHVSASDSFNHIELGKDVRFSSYAFEDLWTDSIEEAEDFAFAKVSEGMFVEIDDWERETTKYYSPEALDRSYGHSLADADVTNYNFQEDYNGNDYSRDDYRKVRTISQIDKNIENVFQTDDYHDSHDPKWRRNWNKGINKDDLREKLVNPTDEDLVDLEKLFADYGYSIDDKGETLFGAKHYQIRFPMENPITTKEEFDIAVEDHIKGLVDAIHQFEDATGFAITWNFGADKKGDITAGVDVREKYVPENLSEETNDKYIGKIYCKKEFDGTSYLLVKSFDGKLYTCQYLSNPKDKSSVIHEFKLDPEDLEWSIKGSRKMNESLKIKRKNNLKESYINEEDMMGDSNTNMDINTNNFFDVEDIFDTEIAQEENDECLVRTATDVMASYQNANKWLDIIKEMLFTDLGCVFFSSYVHNLAHTMPVRFDKFGDILHTVDFKIPYPATEYIPSEPTDINSAFDSIFMILDDIKDKLNAFIKCTDEKYHGMACSAEALLNDIEGEYVPLFKMKKAYQSCEGDLVKFDKWVNQYVNNRSNLSESVKRAKRINKKKLSEEFVKADPYFKDHWECGQKVKMKNGDIKYISSTTDGLWLSNSEENAHKGVGHSYSYSDVEEIDESFNGKLKNTSLATDLRSAILKVLSSEKYMEAPSDEIINALEFMVQYWSKKLNVNESLSEAKTYEYNNNGKVLNIVPLTDRDFEERKKQIEAERNSQGDWAQDYWDFPLDELDYLMDNLQDSDETEATYGLYQGRLWEIPNGALSENTVKQNGKWVNKGKEGTHGKFKTKKAADAQRKAMFANGFGESMNESIQNASMSEIADWLAYHENAWRDAVAHFNIAVNPEDFSNEDECADAEWDMFNKNVSKEELIDWIYDHDQLAKDCEMYFNESYCNENAPIKESFFRVINNDTNEPMEGGSDFYNKVDANRAIMYAKAAANEWDDVMFPTKGYRIIEVEE